MDKIFTIIEIHQTVEEILLTEPPKGEWYSEFGGCIDLSEQLQDALGLRNISTQRRFGRDIFL
jgi:hypothetical protein